MVVEVEVVGAGGWMLVEVVEVEVVMGSRERA